MLSGDVVAYRAIIDIVGLRDRPDWAPNPEEPPVLDDRLLSQIAEERVLIEDRLSRGAERIFGPAFRVELRELRSGESVELIIVVYALYKTAVELNSLVQNLERFRRSIATVLAWFASERRGYEVNVHISSDEPAFELPKKEGGAPWDKAAPVLAAIGTGIGVLGFVAFVGGAIEYARLARAGLPAEQALAVIPTANFVAIGAETIVPAVVAGVFAAAALYLWQLVSSRGAVLSGPPSTRLHDAAQTSDSRFAPTPYKRAVTLVVIFLGLETAAFLQGFEGRGPWEIASFFVLALFTSGVIFVVAFQTRRFFWVAGTAFLSFAVFLGAVAYARARDALEVRPAAAIRGGHAITGFFITETSDQMYLARTSNREGANPRILILAKDEIGDTAVGPLMDPNDAADRSASLAYELCDLHFKERPKRKHPQRAAGKCAKDWAS